jgi:hypothetical protein
MAHGFARYRAWSHRQQSSLRPGRFRDCADLVSRARGRADVGEVIRVLAIVRLLVMVAGFFVVAVFTRRRAKQRLASIATLERPRFAEPTSTDVRGALAEMVGISAASAADSKWTITSAEEGSRGPEVAEAVWSRIPRVSSAVWVAAELPRSVVLPITFAPWKPRALASFERGRRSRYGIDEGVFVRDDRLGRNWLAWVGLESDAARALDADPAVWAVVQRITPALVTATAVAAPDSRELAVPAPSGFRLGSGTRISFRGRFVLVGPGSEPNLAHSSSREDLRQAAQYLANTFHSTDVS